MNRWLSTASAIGRCLKSGFTIAYANNTNFSERMEVIHEEFEENKRVKRNFETLERLEVGSKRDCDNLWWTVYNLWQMLGYNLTKLIGTHKFCIEVSRLITNLMSAPRYQLEV